MACCDEYSGYEEKFYREREKEKEFCTKAVCMALKKIVVKKKENVSSCDRQSET